VHDAAARQFGELQRFIVKFARAARPEGDAEALAAAVIGLAMSHLVRVRLIGERKARAVTMRAFEPSVRLAVHGLARIRAELPPPHHEHHGAVVPMNT
jgi:hypothetical protein